MEVADAVVCPRQEPGSEEEGCRTGNVGVQVPIENSHRDLRLVPENFRIERQAHEHRGAKTHRGVQQPAVWDAAKQPGQRCSFECPPDGDPLLAELQWNRDRDERERRTSHEREPSDVTSVWRLNSQQLPQQQREHCPFKDWNRSDHPYEVTLLKRLARRKEEHAARQHSRDMGIASIARPSAQDEWISHEDGIDSARESQQWLP